MKNSHPFIYSTYFNQDYNESSSVESNIFVTVNDNTKYEQYEYVDCKRNSKRKMVT